MQRQSQRSARPVPLTAVNFKGTRQAPHNAQGVNALCRKVGTTHTYNALVGIRDVCHMAVGGVTSTVHCLQFRKVDRNFPRLCARCSLMLPACCSETVDIRRAFNNLSTKAGKKAMSGLKQVCACWDMS